MGNLPPQTEGPEKQPQNATQRKTFDTLLKHFTVKLEDVKQQRWWTLVTPAFSHIQTYHIVGNLFAFSTFSRMLLWYGIAPLRYGELILVSAVAGNAAFLYQASQRQRQKNRNRSLQSRALGLSAVVMGLGATVSLATPKAKVLLFGAVPIPVWLLMVLYAAYDSARLEDQTSTVGHAAHLGGAASGAIFYLVALRSKAALPFAWMFRS
ncbi:uncharacterized protein Z519_06575 [Cladophialophora bantiana CBS 173.52]|uniref:Peptidase S54 rhomboid domain-containing protein n=1 Tax=Cladophialophora bantiana (strain ATCC 10958 / CBS 173.52 / CDC B-1940 / NIH 8579) TaxID=1442370 RepID=A0A0D2G1W5_CLAB1|nr:uncharacterized protein Z519_06575 [Cladophialophora bantiana CBS 173.52]KIW92727.1 hypothetical protein Z519_06575 [Cladophialophora bantiana CBS 173.52]